MLAALTAVVVVALSLFVTRVATMALTLTGLSRETARFQARSALTGSGFTTSESEQVVNHPVRRRIIMTLMLIGSAGVVTVIGSIVLTFARDNEFVDTIGSTLILALGLALITWASTSKPLDLALQPVITRLLRRYTDIDTRDYARLLHVAGEYSVSELAVEPEDWLADSDLASLRLSGVASAPARRGPRRPPCAPHPVVGWRPRTNSGSADLSRWGSRDRPAGRRR